MDNGVLLIVHEGQQQLNALIDRREVLIVFEPVIVFVDFFEDSRFNPVIHLFNYVYF